MKNTNDWGKRRPRIHAILVIAAMAIAGCAAETGGEAAGSSASLSCPDSFTQRYDFPFKFLLPHEYASGASAEFPEFGYVTSGNFWDNGGLTNSVLLPVDGSGNPLTGVAYVYGDDRDLLRVHSIVLSHDERHLVVTGGVDDNLWIAKIAMPSGTIVWSLSLGEVGTNEEGTYVRRLSPDFVGTDDYLIVGHIYDSFRNNAYMARISDAGVLRWAHRYDDVIAPNPVRDYETVAYGDGPELLVMGIRNELSSPASRDVSIMRLQVATGIIATDVLYYPHPSREELALAIPHIVRTRDGYVVSYGLRGRDNVWGAALWLDSGLGPIYEILHRHPGSPATRGMSIYFDGGSRLYVSTAIAGGSGFDEPGLLMMDTSGSVIGGFQYKHQGQASPMEEVRDGFLLRSNDTASSLWLTQADHSGDACCADRHEVEERRWEVLVERSRYETRRWGDIMHRDVRGPERVDVRNEPCL